MPPTTPPPEESAPFREVFARECEDIRARRESYRLGKPANPDAPPADLKGLALSGGGIRSATFCLGILQRLQADGMLKHFDYLSTVSGGGFIGGWWSAWLAREERTEIFPPAEGLETERGKWASRRDPATAPDGSLRPEGSRNAGIDPVHHLRLFANYLTPRKGALSGDTWRAITVVSRNLFLTILMLVPLLGAAILASQFYFTANHNLVSAYACDAPAALVKPWTELAPTSGPTETPMPVCPEPRNQAGPGHLALVQRVAWLSLPLLVLAGALLLSLVLWMLFSIGRAFMAVVTAVGVTAIFVFLSRSLDWGSPSSFLVQLRDFDAGRLLLIGAVPVALMAAYLLIGRSLAEPPPGGKARPSAGEVLTNRMTRLQSIILVLFTVLGVTLVFGGFAHEAVRFAFQQGEATLGRRLAQTGGWLAVVWAGAGALFTGLKAAPTGGADNHPSTPSRASQLVFAVTPPLVLVVLLMLVATVTHAVLSRVMVFPAEIFPPLILAFFIGILICCIFGTYEFWTDAGADLVRSRVVTWAALGAGAIAMAAAYFLVHPLRYPRELTSAYVGLAAGIVLAPWLLRALLALLSKPSESVDRVVRLRKRLTVVLFTLTPAVSALMGWGFGRIALEPGMPLGTGNPLVAAIAVGGITFTATFVLLASVTATRANHRMLTLLGAAALLLGPMLMQQFLKPTLIEVAVPTAIVALVGIVLGSIIGLGWMLDPNYLSLHTFYRARLVRAYLGASNPNRRDSGAKISDSADGDDVLLANL
ncbi:MAG TPA: patatin-like phospholipase family protein, partial [Gemmatimonadales bacterium]|nr:patatin-like phospholipase family protein [Gemmatimonadales bacterium]